ncbi:MAG TPA: MotA/TolQ/ExbB proton channel family protein [Polyangiaceae bacterium]
MIDPAQSPNARAALDPLELAFQSSGVVLGVLLLLVAASIAVWFIWFLKVGQLARLRSKNQSFEREAAGVELPSDLLALARRHPDSPGGRVVIELGRRRQARGTSNDLMTAVAKRALAAEQQRATTLMPTLSSIASASPFIGLFGTVWGIMDAFLRIGVEKSASLPVVAPAIGEALIATAFGLVAAIPATIGYNYVDKRIGDLMDELGASAEAWVAMLQEEPAGGAVPLQKHAFPAARGGE